MKTLPVLFNKLIIIALIIFAFSACSEDESETSTLKSGNWSGNDISFSVSDDPLRINNLEFTYSYTSCSALHTTSASFTEAIAITGSNFEKEINLYNISGTFLNDSVAAIEISWSGHDSDCNVDFTGSKSFMASFDSSR